MESVNWWPISAPQRWPFESGGTNLSVTFWQGNPSPISQLLLWWCHDTSGRLSLSLTHSPSALRAHNNPSAFALGVMSRIKFLACRLSFFSWLGLKGSSILPEWPKANCLWQEASCSWQEASYWRSELLVTRSELLVTRSELLVTRSELLVTRSEFFATRSNCDFLHTSLVYIRQLITVSHARWAHAADVWEWNCMKNECTANTHESKICGWHHRIASDATGTWDSEWESRKKSDFSVFVSWSITIEHAYQTVSKYVMIWEVSHDHYLLRRAHRNEAWPTKSLTKVNQLALWMAV